jgi:hypothetical protein
VLGLLGCAADTADTGESASELHHGTHGAPTTGLPPIKTVFLIMLENHNWSQIKGSSSAPYINGTLLTQGAHAENYVNVPGLHPSEPNYIWLEAGSNLGLTTDADATASHSIPAGTDHLSAQLERAGKTWRSYQEDMPAGKCPISSSGLYAAKHNPFVFFQDVSGSPPSKTSAKCIENVRPFTELAGDLTAGHAADYNFITPNLCDDSHGAGGCPSNLIKASDDWLKALIPQIQASAQYQNGGAIFITYDESEQGDHPIAMIALSPFANAGHASNVKFSHSSTLRTVEDIFGLPALRDAANATNLADLFVAPAAP